MVLSPAVRTSGVFLVVDLLRCGRRVLTPPGNRDCHVCQLNSVGLAINSQFLCSIEAPFLRPDLGSEGRRAQPRSRLAGAPRRPPPKARAKRS